MYLYFEIFYVELDILITLSKMYVDSSDEGADKDDIDLSSESDDNWEEMSDQDVQDEQDEEDNKSIKFEDDDNDDVDDNDSIHS